MTTEERLDRLEEVSEKLTELTTNVVTAIQNQQEQLDGIISILQRQQEQLADHREMLERHRELLDEVREDTKMTRRLWVRLATKHGWLDDEDSEEDGG